VWQVAESPYLEELTKLFKRRRYAGNLIEKEFQPKTFWHWSLLHECFTITIKDHSMQKTSLPESLKLKKKSHEIFEY
jgi:hypothetical protein